MDLAKPRILATMFYPAAMGSPGDVNGAWMEIAHRVRLMGGAVWIKSRSGSMDCERTKFCQLAIRKGFSHALMLDADHIHPPDLAERLIAHNVDVVGGLNYMRQPPHGACASIGMDGPKHIDPKKGTGLVEVIAVGTGCMLIRLECLKKLPQPWFYMPYDGIDYDDLQAAWPGEDGGFCLRCLTAGVRMYCDTDLTSPHITSVTISEPMPPCST